MFYQASPFTSLLPALHGEARGHSNGFAWSKVRYVMNMENIYIKHFNSMLMGREDKINATSALFRVVISCFFAWYSTDNHLLLGNKPQKSKLQMYQTSTRSM